MTSWSSLRAEAEHELVASGVPASVAPLEARFLIEHVSGADRGELASMGSDPAPARGVNELDRLLARRGAGEPLQYVIGSWSFRGIDLFVDRRVLIPRPETEITAEIALEMALKGSARRGRPDPWSARNDDRDDWIAVDLGTGSGALALALVVELPDAVVWATDVSRDALAVARANIAGTGTTRVRLAEGSWYRALDDELRNRVRLIVANPPYVAQSELAGLAREIVDHEPREALVSGPTGLEAIEAVVAEAPSWLASDGAVVCELAPHQAEAATTVAETAGFADVEVRRDLTGRPRVLVARRAGVQR